MARCPSQDAERYHEHEEEVNYGMCFNAASEAGHTSEEAEECDSGNLECPLCPWGPGR